MANIGKDHIVSSYNDELVALAQTIAEMGDQVEVAIENGTKALLKLDRELAELIKAYRPRLLAEQGRHADRGAPDRPHRRRTAIPLRRLFRPPVGHRPDPMLLGAANPAPASTSADITPTTA